MTFYQTSCQIFDISKTLRFTRGNQRTKFFDTYIPANTKSLLKRLKIAFSGILTIYKKPIKSTQNGL